MHHHHHNSICKFHFQHSLDRCNFKSAVVDASLNSLIVNSKLLLPLYYFNLNLGGQCPKVKETERSIASFRVRPGMVMGTLVTLSSGSYSFKNFMTQLRYSFLPSVSRKKEGLDLKVCYLGKGSSSVSLGVDELTSLYSFFLLPSAFFTSTELGGCNITVRCGFKERGVNRKSVIAMHKFFFSCFGFPV